MSDFTQTIIFGKEQVNKLYCGVSFTPSEINNNIKVFSFDSEKELNAFLQGIEQAIGWTEYYLLNEQDYSKITNL